MIDSHCHLADAAFAPDLAAVIDRAREAGVSAALVILAAGDEAEAAQAARLVGLWDAVQFAAGVHPHQAQACPERGAAAELARRAAETHPQVRAVGEVGLDYHYDFSPRDVQRRVFAEQVALARELGRPLIIHTRDAETDTFDILEAEGGGDVTGIFHCFTGDAAMARRVLDLGFSLSFAGIITFPRAQSVRDAAAVVPDDRLLIETDSPYLAPVPHRGRRNEPARVRHVLEALAAVRRVSAEALEAVTTANFWRLVR